MVCFFPRPYFGLVWYLSLSFFGLVFSSSLFWFGLVWFAAKQLFQPWLPLLVLLDWRLEVSDRVLHLRNLSQVPSEQCTKSTMCRLHFATSHYMALHCCNGWGGIEGYSCLSFSFHPDSHLFAPTPLKLIFIKIYLSKVATITAINIIIIIITFLPSNLLTF